jgi:CubicO group peptidase (beta-lactamase class C family)
MNISRILVAIIAIFLVPPFLTANSAKPLPSGSWEKHGFDDKQKESIRSAFQRGIEEKFIPGGAMMLIHKGEVIFQEGFGLADLETKRPFTTDSYCRIASLTKPHTCTMMAFLVDQGEVSFNDPVDKYIPAFSRMRLKGSEEIFPSPTLAQCLSHTAGFASNNDLKAGKLTLNFDGDLESVTAELATKRLFEKSGTNYAYSRLGYMTAGRVAEIVMDKSYVEIMEDILFQKIEAEASTFDADSVKEKMATPYERKKTGFVERTGEGMGTAINPGGNLITNLDGVARLFLLHRNQGKVNGERVISEEALQQMYVDQPGSNGVGYGFGFRFLKKRPDGTGSRIQHTGASGTIGIIDFDMDFIIIVLTQVPQAQTNKWRNPLLQSIFTVFED